MPTIQHPEIKLLLSLCTYYESLKGMVHHLNPARYDCVSGRLQKSLEKTQEGQSTIDFIFESLESIVHFEKMNSQTSAIVISINSFPRWRTQVYILILAVFIQISPYSIWGGWVWCLRTLSKDHIYWPNPNGSSVNRIIHQSKTSDILCRIKVLLHSSSSEEQTHNRSRHSLFHTPLEFRVNR